MKLVIIILFTCLMQVSAGTLAQKITLNERNAPLGSVIDKIRAQTGYDFIFNYNDVAKANKVSVSLDAENLNDALKEIFKNQELTYSAYFSETDPLVSDQTDRLTGCRTW